MSRAHRQGSLVATNKKPVVLATRRIADAFGPVPIQFAGQAVMKRNPACAPFEGLDEKHCRSRIHIAHAEAERLSKVDARAVQGEHERSV